MSDKQKGFTLVELLVAMSIGTVIILGAGQLFLTSFQTFQTVDRISRKQETLIFAVNVVTEAGRIGNMGNYATVKDERSSSSGARYYCVLQNQEHNQPAVDLAQVDEATVCPTLYESNDDGVSYLITLLVGDCREGLGTTCDEIMFTISERNKAISLQEATP